MADFAPDIVDVEPNLAQTASSQPIAPTQSEQPAQQAAQNAQPTPQTPNYKLWKGLNDQGLYTKTYNNFTSQFSTPDRVNKLFEQMSQAGLYTKDAESFHQQFFANVPSQSANDAKGYYNALNRAGYPVGTYQQYATGLQNPIFVNKVYSGLMAAGYNQSQLGTLTDFRNKMLATQIDAPMGDSNNSLFALLNHTNVAQEHPTAPIKPVTPGLPAYNPNKQQQINKLNELLNSQKAIQNTKAQVYPNALPADTRSLYEALPADQKQDFLNSPQFGLANLDNLKNMTPDDFKHWQYMNETTAGQMQRGLQYSGMKLSQGAIQIGEGAAHVVTLPVSLFTDKASNAITNASDWAQDHATFGLTKGDVMDIEANPINKGLGDFIQILPSVWGGEATGAKKIIFGLQGVGQGKQMIDQTNASPTAKALFPLATGIVNSVFMGDAGETIFAKLPNPIRTNIVNEVTAKAIKDAAGQEITPELLQNEANTVLQKIKGGSINYIKTLGRTTADLSALNNANWALQKATNAIDGKQVFDTRGSIMQNIIGNIGESAKQAALFSLPGAFASYSKPNDFIADKLVQDPSQAEQIKSDLTVYGLQNGWSQDEIQAANVHVDKIAEVAKRLPNFIPPEKRPDAVNLILGRTDLQNQLADVEQSKSNLDPAIRDVQLPVEQLLTDKIDQANDKLKEIVTGRPTEYTGDDEKGKYSKTLPDGRAEPINKSRFALEQLEQAVKTSKDIEREGNDATNLSDEVSDDQQQDIHGIHVIDADGNMHNEYPDGIHFYDAHGNLENKHYVTPSAADVINGAKIGQRVDADTEVPPLSSTSETSLPLGGHSDADKPASNSTAEPLSTDPNLPKFSSSKEADRYWIENETDPRAIAARYHVEQPNEPDYIEKGIIDYLGNSKINLKDYQRWGDRNNLDADKLRRWIDTKNSDKIDLATHAEILSHELGVQVTPEDFIETIDRYRGRKNFNESAKNDVQRMLEQRYQELTGKNLTPSVAEKSYLTARELSPDEQNNFNAEALKFGLSDDDFNDYESSKTRTATGTDNQRNAGPTSYQVSKSEPDQSGRTETDSPGESQQSTGPLTLSISRLNKSDINSIKEDGITPNDIQAYETAIHQSREASGLSEAVQQPGNDRRSDEQQNTSRTAMDQANSSWTGDKTVQGEKPLPPDGEQPAEPKDGNGTTTPGNGIADTKPESRVATANVESPKAGDALRKLADRIEAGKISKLGGFSASTGFDVLWDASLSLVAKSLREGAKLADAIESGLNYMRQSDWYKSLTDKKDFEDKYTQHITAEFNDAVNLESKPKEPLGITKEQTRIQRENRGLEDLPEPDQRTLKDMFEDGRHAIETGEIDPRKLASDISDKPRNLSSTEVNALLQDRRALYDESDRLHNAINFTTADDDPLTVQSLTDRLKYVEQQLDLNEQAMRSGARENALALVSMQSMITHDYTLSSQLARMRAKAGGELTPAMRAEVEKYHSELEQAKKELEDFKQAAAKRRAELAVEDELTSQRKTKKAAVKADLKAERKEIVKGFLVELEKIRKSPDLYSDIPYRRELVAAVPFMKRMLTNLIKDGIVEFKDVIDTIHEEFAKHIDGLTKRDVMDALAGNYNERKETENDLVNQRNAIKRLSKLTGDLDDLKKGIESETNEKRLVKRRADIANLENQIKELKSAAKLETLPDRQRETYIKQLHRDIDRLDEQIAKGAKEIKPSEDKYANDVEINKLRAEREQKTDELNKIDPRQKEAADLNRTIKATERSINEYEQRIANNDLHPQNGSRIYHSHELDALRAKRNDLKAKYEQLRSDEFTPEERLQQSLQKRLDMLNSRIANKDFEPAPTKPQPNTISAKTIALQAKVRRAENNFDAMAERLGKHTQSRFESSLELYRKINLAFILSGVKTMQKLYSFGAAKRISNVLDELANTVNAHTPGIKAVINRSPRYAGGIDFGAEAKAIAARWNAATLKDTWHSLKTGNGDLEMLYGKQGVDKDFINNSSSILDVFQHIHSALKTPTKRAEFFRSMEHRLNFYAKQGEDINDPDVQLKTGLEAFADAKRAILMNDNLLTDKFYKGGLTVLERSKGDAPKALAAFIRSVFPVTKIPTNYVLNTYDRITGAIPGLSRATPKFWQAIANGAESLTPEQADVAARIFSKGQVGLGLMAIAFMSKGLVGGYYSGKRDAGDLKPGDLQIGDFSVPHQLLHNDVIEAMQMAGTIRRAIDAGNEKHNGSGVMLGIGQGAAGVAKEIPFVNNEYATDLSSPKKATNVAGTFLKSRTEPQLLQEIAKATDKPEEVHFSQHPLDYIMAPTIERKPTSVLEYLKTGIPGLREQVSEAGNGGFVGKDDQTKRVNDFIKHYNFKVTPFDKADISYPLTTPGKSGKNVYVSGKIAVTLDQQKEIDSLRNKYFLKFLNGTMPDGNGGKIPTMQFYRERYLPVQIKQQLTKQWENAFIEAKDEFLKNHPEMKSKVRAATL